jgi:hypothetical protein
MRNRVEVLRSICFTEEDLENITNLADLFTKKEIEFVVEFKKIYELGLGQLKKFIDKLDEEGKDLDEYTIQYYVNLLLNGPLGNQTRELSKDKKYFSSTPNMMGFFGNKARNLQNTTVLEDYDTTLGTTVDIFNKLPKFMQSNVLDAVKINEEIFRTSLRSSTIIDNTLPTVDKAPQQRYSEEPTGKWTKKPHGTYLVKDSNFFGVLDSINKEVFNPKLKDYLGEENFRIWRDKKGYNPFSEEDNTSVSSDFNIEKKIQDSGREVEMILDIHGNVKDSVKRRESVLKIPNPNKDKEYLLGSVEGQLGI